MKSEMYGLTKQEKIIEFYRENPIEACRDLLKVDPVWFQRIQLRELWTKPYCCMKWGRGSAKTSTNSIYVVLRAMLYPGLKIGIIAPSFRQTGYLFDEIEILYSKSPFFRAAVRGHIRRTTESCIAKFHNESSIEGLPIGNDGSKIRGRRYVLAVLDEYSYHDETTINLVVRPFLTVQKGYKPNQLIICSTPSYKTNHFWGQYTRHKENAITKPELYSCTSFNFLDVMIADHPIYRIDLNFVYENFLDQTTDDFLMEYGGYFPSEGSGFFPGWLISQCEPRVSPIEMEFIGQEDCEYVMGIDPARSEEGDNFALTIMKLLPNQIRHVVRVVTTKGKSYPELADLIREQVFLRKFDVVKICMDYGGGGNAIQDLLIQTWTHEGVSYPSIGTKENVLDINSYNAARVIPILEMVHFNVPLIDYMYTTLKADLEHKKILFPLTVRRDPDQTIETHGKEFGMLKSEMQHLTPKQSTKGLTFVGSPKIGKDRITSCILANYAANLVFKKDIIEEDRKSIVIPQGFWIE